MLRILFVLVSCALCVNASDAFAHTPDVVEHFRDSTEVRTRHGIVKE